MSHLHQSTGGPQGARLAVRRLGLQLLVRTLPEDRSTLAGLKSAMIKDWNTCINVCQQSVW